MDDLIDASTICRMAGISPTKLFTIIDRNILNMPKPIKIFNKGGKTHRLWIKSEISAWLEKTDCKAVIKRNGCKKEVVIDVNKLNFLNTYFTDRTSPLILPGSLHTKYKRRRSTQYLSEFDPVPEFPRHVYHR